MKKIRTKIAMGLIIAAITGGVFWIGNKDEQIRIIYADVKADKTRLGSPLLSVDFYSIKNNGTEQKKIFSLTANQLEARSVNLLFGTMKICSANGKIYFQTRGFKNLAPYESSYVREIDSAGKIRDLKFTEQQNSQYKDLEFMDNGFSISPDCKKIAWSTSYFQIQNHQETGAFNEIYAADINGQNKKVVLSSSKSSTNKIKEVYKWSNNDRNVVYITDYNWDRNGGGGGLYKLNIITGKLQTINQVPSDGVIYDISKDETKIAYTSNLVAWITNLNKDFLLTFENYSNGKRIFSPSGNKLANINLFYGSNVGDKEERADDLYVYNGVKNIKVASNVSLESWLSENTLLVSRTNSLMIVNANGSDLKNFATVSEYPVFIGITK